MTTVLDVLVAVLLVAGTSLTVVAAIGMFRVPDAYARIHVATKPATLGIACTLAAAALRAGWGAPTSKLLLALALQFWTVPAASHLLGRAARAAGEPPAEPGQLDEDRDGSR